MAIKLYKSQLEPTSKTSNVADRRQISMNEAGSIGRAFKGMMKSGENLYVKHLDIKSDNELLEKSKEVMNGTETKTGLSETILKAKEMKDPDAAVKSYNDAWKTWLDTEKNNVSWMAKKKLTNWMNKQQLKDTNSIKVSATTNMINGLRVNITDQANTLAKTIVYGSTEFEKETAKKELETLLGSKKTSEAMGAKLDVLKKSVERDIAFYGYKNVAVGDYAKALELAKKDDRLEIEDIEKLKTHFKTSRATNNKLNKDTVAKMETAMTNGITYNQEEYNLAMATAIENNDQATIIKLQDLQTEAGYYVQLSTMTTSEIENRVNILNEYKNKKVSEGTGMENKYAINLATSKKFLAKLESDLNKDQLKTGSDRGIQQIEEIGFNEMLMSGNVEEFANAVNARIAKAETIAAFYTRPPVYFTETELKSIQTTFANVQNTSQIIQLTSALVNAFGDKSDTAFKQISKSNTVLAHLGGLVIMNDKTAGENAELLAEGFMISQNEQLKNIYQVPTSDVGLLTKVRKYSKIFGSNTETFNNTVEAANYIYMATLKRDGKTKKNFDKDDWEKAFLQASGQIRIKNKFLGMDYLSMDDKMGGYDKDTRGNDVHIPSWLPTGSFSKVVERIKADENLWLKSSNGKNAVIADGANRGNEITLAEIFKEGDPYFVSIGNGKYRIATGEDPTSDGDPEYLMNSDGNYFVININKIRDEIITGIN